MRRLLLLLPETSIDELVTSGTCLNGKSHGYYVYDNEEVDAELINKVRGSLQYGQSRYFVRVTYF